MRAYWRVLAGMKGKASTAVLLLGVGGGLEALSLLLLAPVLGNLLGGGGEVERWLSVIAGSKEVVLPWALLLLALAGVGASLCKFFGEAMILRIRNRVEVEAGTAMAHGLFAVAWQPYATLRQGDIAKSLLIEGDRMAYGVRLFLSGWGMALTALPLVVSACLMSLEMTAYTLGFGVGAALLFRIAAAPVRQQVARLSDSISSISLHIADVFGNLKFFRSTGLVSEAEKEVESAYRRYAKAYFDSQIYQSALRYGVEAAAVLFIAGFLYWQLAVEGNSPATVLVFLAIFYRLVPKIMAAQDFLFQATTYTPWFEAWQQRKDFCDRHQRQSLGCDIPGAFGELSFRGVSFSYGDTPVLSGIAFDLAPGHCTAIVGGSGGGKTTLLDLTTGLLRPSSGKVLVAGRALESLELASWQRKIGLVPQDCPIFFASVLQNIAWGDEQPDREWAEICARRAHAWEFIEKLPEGMDAIVGERGANLSGGQKQRLGIARALYRRPWLLILDEATSALDQVSEKAVQDALAELKGSMAVLLVAHRLQTVAMADHIIVLEQGKIAESGTWDELVGLQGKFSNLVQGQARTGYNDHAC